MPSSALSSMHDVGRELCDVSRMEGTMSRVRATGQLPKEQSVDDGGGVEDETLQFLNLHH
jgi:hypothetical protein